MRSLKRLIPACAIAACVLGVSAGPTLASTTQESMIQDNSALAANTPQAMETFADLGVTMVKVAVYWNEIAPNPNSAKPPKGFKATNPNSYKNNWAFLDNVVNLAKTDDVKVGFMIVGPAPKWATGAGHPTGCWASSYCGNWKPSDSAFRDFVKAIGKRYDGKFKPSGSSTALPRVSWWSIWNEPNYGPTLAPQTTNKNKVGSAAYLYRGLADAAYSGLTATGHKPSSDTILFGETAPRGSAIRQNTSKWSAYKPGSDGGTMPLIFLSQLYCVGQNGKPLTGAAAKAEKCPTSRAKFKKQNPVLFNASGFAIHPYAQGTPPNVPTYASGRGLFSFNTKSKKKNPYYADFAQIGTIAKKLDSYEKQYHSSKKLSIYNTEFGYWTNPPKPHNATAKRESLSQKNAAYYMNWAEYLSYKNSRVASFDQYQLFDSNDSSWTDGLLTAKGKQKPGFAAFMTPLYLPTTTGSSSKKLMVWGAVRPASNTFVMGNATPQAEIWFQAKHGSATKIATVKVRNKSGYFTTKQKFPASGNVWIQWKNGAGKTFKSRKQAITIR